MIRVPSASRWVTLMNCSLRSVATALVEHGIKLKSKHFSDSYLADDSVVKKKNIRKMKKSRKDARICLKSNWFQISANSVRQ